MRIKLLAISLGVLVLLAITASLALAQTGDPVKGKDEWAQNNCKSCHGANGEGAFAGPRAGDGKTVVEWIAQVRQPRNQMPAFRPDQVPDQMIADMQAYMQTLPKPASFTPTIVPIAANDPEGKKLLIQKRCVACHGDGQGLVQANFTARNRQVTFDAVLKQVRDPFRRMPIFGESKLSNDQVRQIADFLASYQTQTATTPAPAAAAATTAPAAATAVAATTAPTSAPAAATPVAAAAAPKPATLPVTGGAPVLPLLGGLLALALLIGGSFVLRRHTA